ncbi:MAG: hypothetical protein SGILL_007094 [Bacillariaceae sp.]
MSYNYDELVGKISAARDAVKTAAAATSNRDNAVILQHLEESLGHFETLSQHCPMVPGLWIQYAYDACQLANMALGQEYGVDFKVDALEMGMQILKLGIEQFPGCAILYLLQNQLGQRFWDLKRDTVSGDEREELIHPWLEMVDNAVEQVGKGSHRNEGVVVKEIYHQVAVNTLIVGEIQPDFDHLDAIVQVFCDRAGCPMNMDLNCSIQADYQDFIRQESNEFHTLQCLPEASQKLEHARRREATLFSQFQTYEDDVTIAMQQEGILSPHLATMDGWENVQQLVLENDSDRSNSSWMGMGGIQTAQAFITYAQACSRYKNKEDSDVEKTIHSLVHKIYERGVSECPTVETLWLSYLKQLHFEMRRLRQNRDEGVIKVDNYAALLETSKKVADRAVRNCPYSVALVRERLDIMLLLADAGKATLDPEELYKTTILQETIGNGFITTEGQILELFLTTTQVVRRRILAFLSVMAPPAALEDANNKQPKKKKKTLLPKFYDDPEPIAMPVASNADMDDDKMQELEDLCTDLREIYDDMDEYLRKNHQKFKEGRAKLWMDRGWTETHLVGPIMACVDGEEDASNNINATRYEEVIKAFDKATKVRLPVHPSLFMQYAQAALTSYPVTRGPYHVMNKMRQVRRVYQTALQSVGKPKDQCESNAMTLSVQELDYETALRCLCREYLEFEQYFGSAYSHADASMTVQKKLSRAFANGIQHQDDAMAVEEENNGKRKHAAAAVGDDIMDQGEETSAEPSTKKQKTENASREKQKTTLSVPKPVKHKVKVGNMDYPAHPYTVRVSFLSPTTQDMDLVDIFRPKCGAVVHAKIMRDKNQSHHGKGKSKGWGLVQFEEKESVEKALALSDVIGIDEKSVKIERSHLPAVGLVPPGMHRVNPKGKGKSTKHNQKRKESHETKVETVKIDTADSKAPASTATSTASTLSFRPRVVSTKGQPKPKLALPKADKK